MMKSAELFVDNGEQAVRLPEEFRFEGDQVVLKRIGNAVILIPYEEPWQTLFDSLGMFSDDFMLERTQPNE